MGRKILLVVPEAPVAEPASTIKERAVSKGELRLGVLDNSKGNADHLLRFIAESIKAALPVKSVISLRKGSVSLPAPGGILDQLTAEADFVVSAMAD
jgi:hypothetical protein